MQEVWRGGVAAWECDDNGHLNSRFYVAHAMSGLAVLFARLGLPGLFAPGSATTLLPRDVHIRYHRESAAGTALRMEGGLLSVGEAGADAVFVISEVGGGDLRATVRLGVSNVDAASLGPAGWPAGALRDLPLVDLPAAAAPRGVAPAPAETAASLERAEALGLVPIGLGAIGPAHLDAFGRMAPHIALGLVSDGIRTLSAPLRKIVLSHADPRPSRVGGAVLEMRVVHHAWPRAGDLYDIRSGLDGVEKNVRSMTSWILDPVSGRPWASLQAIGVDFDLEARRIVPIAEAARAELLERVVPGLGL
ncbi:acyl-ACP thioesterase [Wenxinia marina]|uniref:Thioesterase n=1 Tax=Wenxinia marina DSM 24838 TaxID=1123501 RepID=A0A0D0P9X3_9RHOB|nr:acyl-ACP thioesterase [Wenxinia marina]KIQ68311.1 hypothetical protein Wenmar_03150 [Wenxinia marina DSM 24838]GGL79653.1 thioesterase [Wenxinia marina]